VAKPPEPLEEMLPKATLVVLATVKRVVSTGAPLPPLPEHEGHKSDIGARSPEQTLELEVNSVLKGQHEGLLTVKKPIAGYSVREGTTGAWLIDDSGTVLGRYGPDSWRAQHVQDALK
jgi:hypothetical protein